MTPFYLAEDPSTAATLVPTADLSKCIVEVCQVLSMVWLRAETANRWTDWAKMVQTSWENLDSDMLPRDLSWRKTTLCGQRIYGAGNFTNLNAAAVWASQYGGNYLWLYRFGWALLDEFKARSNKLHAASVALQTLELLPPTLTETEGTYSDFEELQ